MRLKHVGVRVFVFHLLNYFADVDGNLYESCATGGHLSAIRFDSLHSDTNMADARTCQVGSAPAPLSVGFSNNVLLIHLRKMCEVC
jgi:hypothetical protein